MKLFCDIIKTIISILEGKSMENEYMKLNNGVQIPKLGLGTWLIDDSLVVQAVRDAVKIGYRHIDTAQAYENEHGVGEGIRSCDVPRNEIFVTSKVAAENKTYNSAINSINETLQKMNLEYIDMMIIHSPQPWKEVNQSENRYHKENIEVWQALEDAYKTGKVRAIGLSNFLISDIKNILQNCTIKPMVNQILVHISNTPLELIDFCKQNGIIVEAYSPIAHGEILQNAQIAEIAHKYGVSIPQLCIRYCLQLDLVTLPKTANTIHMKDNVAVDFVIGDEDMNSLKCFEHIKDYGKSSFFPVYGGKL